MDYGIMAGFQFNLPVNSHLILQPGIRINYGLPNIFKGDRYIPQNFLRTHNAAAGLYLGIGYRFPTFSSVTRLLFRHTNHYSQLNIKSISIFLTRKRVL